MVVTDECDDFDFYLPVDCEDCIGVAVLAGCAITSTRDIFLKNSSIEFLLDAPDSERFILIIKDIGFQ